MPQLFLDMQLNTELHFFLAVHWQKELVRSTEDLHSHFFQPNEVSNIQLPTEIIED